MRQVEVPPSGAEAVLPSECLTGPDPAFFFLSFRVHHAPVPPRRRSRGFEPVGRLPLDGLGLPKSRAREMVLAQAWEEVAGRAIAARARPLRVVRGLLEIEVEDGPWAESLGPLVPGLAGRLSARHPELGVRKFRLLRTGSVARESPRDLEAPEDADHGPREDSAERQAAETPAPAAKLGERLPELASRYMARRKRRPPGQSQ